ncbi:hypothetical protein PZN02_002585 [Sinorhizobium garamanticum]|uniref:DUF4440 domain-containing protein n=1 Tax=Sinorhizobium garamanticum TaxID=680247 RepID=A0ABY8D619_9HYPH|nr:hypothetical protein [Sinorhizobium garamanticum]WEX86311.1 hypothetical protein PZN02_002585 [Sinorhizobium garamanticum]
MDDAHAWETEQRLWLEGPDTYRKLLDKQCIMAFPAPVGLMQGPSIIDSLEGAPRWDRVVMTDRTIGRPAHGCLVLAYRAEGHRADRKPYAAYCTSTYCDTGVGWKLVQHQQAAIG